MEVRLIVVMSGFGVSEQNATESAGRAAALPKNLCTERTPGDHFRGVFPRMAAISLGGFIFLGAYDHTHSLLLEVGRNSP
ncbi:hypothetical protein H8959_020809 [Pygathrix nigripes]